VTPLLGLAHARRARRPAARRRFDRLLDRGREDAGNAVVEFVFVALVVMVPLIYLIVLFATIQRDQLAVTTAAREAGRAFATADTPAQGLGRARVAAAMAYQDAGLGASVQLSFVAADQKCGSAEITPTLQAGSEFAVCVVNHDELPAVPVVFQGRHGLSSEGRFVVHIDDYR
jgi:Flp pilus assembly protein TadG